MRTTLPGLALACLLGTLPVLPTHSLDHAAGAPPTNSQAAAGRIVTRPVYSCVEDGVPVLADRPCAVGPADARHFVLRTPPTPGEEPTTAPRGAPPARMHDAATAPRAPARPGTEAAPCQRLRQRLDALDERMRQGYRAREAGRLWDQRRGLKQGLRAAGC